jgi:hypothetical protein
MIILICNVYKRRLHKVYFDYDSVPSVSFQEANTVVQRQNYRSVFLAYKFAMPKRHISNATFVELKIS